MTVIRSDLPEDKGFEMITETAGRFNLKIDSVDGPDESKASAPLLWRLVDTERPNASMLHSTPTQGPGAGIVRRFIEPLDLPSTVVSEDDDGNTSIEYDPEEAIGVVIDANVTYDAKWDNCKLKNFRLAPEDVQNQAPF